MKPSPTPPSNRTVSSVKDKAVIALISIYVEAGLPLLAAFEAAMADYADFEKNRQVKERPLCAA
jgi:hypothetical protein